MLFRPHRVASIVASPAGGLVQRLDMFTFTFFLTSGRSFQDLFASLFQVSVQQLANYDTEAKQRAKEGKVVPPPPKTD